MLHITNRATGTKTAPRIQTRIWPRLQILLILVVWLFVCWMHWDNDGLWYHDAPHHAANGLFWKDFLLDMSLDAKAYAVSYYARYPVISPTAHPPVFYFIESALFAVFGPSPYVAKGAVLGLALVAALYASAWARRWIGEDAAWAGALLLLLPGVIRWSHAIMLNVPALAFSVAALYHLRRWLESPPESARWRHLYIGAFLATLSMLTYVTSCVLVFIVVVWLILERRWRLLWNRRTLVVLVLSALALLPWVLLVVKEMPHRAVWFVGTADYAQKVLVWNWGYYLRQLPELFSTPILCVAAFGIAAGVLARRWRHETVVLLSLSVVCYAFFSYVSAHEGRYILLLSLPIVLFCLLAILSTVQCLVGLLRANLKWQRAAVCFAVTLLLVVQAWLGRKVEVPSTSGFSQLVEYLEDVAPDDWVFYDGVDYHNFTFYLQAGDPDYRRRAVLGRRLLYATGMDAKPQEFVSSPKEVVEVLRTRGGCQWVAVADRPSDTGIAAPSYLREAVKGPQFELATSFPIVYTRETGVGRMSVCVYRFLVSVEPVDVVDMPIYSLGQDRSYQIKPIQR